MTSKLGKITKVVETTEEGIILEISLRDAVVLARILDNVGGSPEGLRGSASRIALELNPILTKHNIRFFDGLSITVDGSLYLNGDEEEVEQLDARIRSHIKR